MALWVDINLILGGGWPPSEMDQMSIAELLHWHELVLARQPQD